MAALTDADKVLRNDTGLAIVEKLEDIADALGGESIIDDTATSSTKTWSSQLESTIVGGSTYNSSSTYNKGDNVIYNGTLYACNDNSVTGAWDATKWDATTLQPKTDNTLDTTAKTITGAINELNTGKADAFTMKALTASDVFSNTTNISQFYGYQIGKVIFITRLVVTGGTQTTDKTVYATFNNAYKPNVATRFVWDKNGDGILVRGVCDPTDGLIMSDGTSLGGLAFSFTYQIS